ncbi:hypothetical protein MBBAR_37c00010, partial [Methanobrevibacter arboriphilus JCM 13429 = DSM 1125]
TGNITVIVSFTGNENFTGFSNSTSFEVLRNSTNSTIIVNPNPVSIGENVTISGQLDNFTGITGVNVTIDGNTQTLGVNSTGGWNFNYTTNKTGNITVIVSFTGNENFTAFSNSTSFEVLRNSTNSTIIVNPNPVSIGNNVTISGQLDNFTGINGVNVTIDGNTQTLGVNSTGGWSLNYTTNRTGNINVNVNYAGNDNYTIFTNTSSFTVSLNDTNSSIVVNPDSVNIGNNVTISGQLVGYVGNGSDILTVSVDGNLYNNVTINSTGGWTLNYTTNRTGTITVNVTYAGNENYTAFSNSTTFEVERNSTNSTLIVVPSSVNIGNNVTISGELVGYVGNGSDSLTVSVDGNLYENVAVDGTGGWNLTYLTNRTGNIIVIVSFSGNENYTAFTNNTSFNVANGSTNSSIVVDHSGVNIGENVTIFGQLDNFTGIASVNVTIDGITQSMSVNVTGGWSLNYITNKTGNIT